MADWHFSRVFLVLFLVFCDVYHCYCFISESAFKYVNPQMLIILLCGDVHLNPGPPVDYPCGICSNQVTDNDEAVCCDLCNRWIHISCDHSLTSADYKMMLDNPSNDPWFCCNCSARTPGVSRLGCGSSLSCICLNARSVVSKRFDFLAYICANQFDIVAVTETFLDTSVHDSHVSPPGYSVFRYDWDRHGGGVMLLVHDSLNAFRCLDLENDCELLWVELPAKSSSVLFGVVYRSPSSPVSYLEEFRNSLLRAVACDLPVFVCGDFNLPNIDWTTVVPSIVSSHASTFCDIMSDCFLTQLVTFPTCQNHILDLVLTNHPDYISSINSYDNLPDTDHTAVHFAMALTLRTPLHNARLLYRYQKIDHDHFTSVFSNIPWDVIDYTGDIELSWSMWKDLFLSAIDSTVPKVKWKSRKLKHWFS